MKSTAVAGPSAILHWTNGGTASWYHFAVAIQDLALARRILSDMKPIHSIKTAQCVPWDASRPAYSALDSSATHALIAAPTDDWRTALSVTIDEIADTA